MFPVVLGCSLLICTSIDVNIILLSQPATVGLFLGVILWTSLLQGLSLQFYQCLGFQNRSNAPLWQLVCLCLCSACAELQKCGEGSRQIYSNITNPQAICHTSDPKYRKQCLICIVVSYYCVSSGDNGYVNLCSIAFGLPVYVEKGKFVLFNDASRAH